MIAIFSLPSVQGLDRAFSPNQNCQNQSICTPQLDLVLTQRVQAVQFQPINPQLQWKKFSMFQPRFVAQIFPLHAPIRGSPVIA